MNRIWIPWILISNRVNNLFHESLVRHEIKFADWCNQKPPHTQHAYWENGKVCKFNLLVWCIVFIQWHINVSIVHNKRRQLDEFIWICMSMNVFVLKSCCLLFHIFIIVRTGEAGLRKNRVDIWFNFWECNPLGFTRLLQNEIISIISLLINSVWFAHACNGRY